MWTGNGLGECHFPPASQFPSFLTRSCFRCFSKKPFCFCASSQTKLSVSWGADSQLCTSGAQPLDSFPFLHHTWHPWHLLNQPGWAEIIVLDPALAGCALGLCREAGMSRQCARFPRQIKSSSALQDSKTDGQGTKPGSGWLKDYVHRGEMAQEQWLRISSGKEHGQGPNLCSMKLGVVICGEVVASPGFALFISKRSKESETGCSHVGSKCSPATRPLPNTSEKSGTSVFRFEASSSKVLGCHPAVANFRCSCPCGATHSPKQGVFAMPEGYTTPNQAQML